MFDVMLFDGVNILKPYGIDSDQSPELAEYLNKEKFPLYYAYLTINREEYFGENGCYKNRELMNKHEAMFKQSREEEWGDVENLPKEGDWGYDEQIAPVWVIKGDEIYPAMYHKKDKDVANPYQDNYGDHDWIPLGLYHNFGYSVVAMRKPNAVAVSF